MHHLLERDDELDRLRGWAAEAAVGRGRVVFVGGEAGIGKTALVTALTDDVGRTPDGPRIAVGRCDALLTPRPLGPFLDVAATLGLAAASDRDQLLQLLVGELRTGRPTVLVVEDAHWADAATVELIALLARRAVDLCLLLVVTYRDDEVAPEHGMRLVLGDLASARGTAWMNLQPLTREAVGQLAGAAGTTVDDLYERTVGNPFYVTEVLAAPADAVPATVRLAVLARAARLPPDARDVLSAVALVPGRAEGWLVEAMCHPPAGALLACTASGVLRADGTTYAFRHELARRAIELDVPADRRRELHQRAVDALAAKGDGDAARLAHHAAGAADDGALARYALLASREAVARQAYREAVELGERALTVEHRLTEHERAELRTDLVTPLNVVGRGADAVRWGEDAVAHWRAVGEVGREARVLSDMSPAFNGLGDSANAMASLARAVALLEALPPGPELAAAYCRMTSLTMIDRDRDRAAEWGERALAAARAWDDTLSLSRALVEYGIADVLDGRAEGLPRIYEGMELGRRHGHTLSVLAGYGQIGSGCGELRRYDLAMPALVDGLRYSIEHGIEFNARYTRAWLARCRFDLGDWDEADAEARAALAGPHASAIVTFVAKNTLGWLRTRRGDDDAWPLFDDALAIARRTGQLQRLWPVAVARAEAGWLAGDIGPHVALLAEALALAVRYRHGVAIGELGVWLQRSGQGALVPVDRAAPPFAPLLVGEPLAAAAEFQRLGCPYEAAMALDDAGDVASRRAALATFDRLGAEPMATRVAAALADDGVRVRRRRGRSSPATQPAGLSDRELEVLRLVAAGFTNPQIASTLYISRKTAEHHVSNILAKLSVVSRSEAAAAAVRLGITDD